MYPGQIPTLDDIKEILLEKLARTDLTVYDVFQTNSRSFTQTSPRFGDLFNYQNPLPSKDIVIDMETLRASVIHTSALGQYTYRDHNVLDEFYHWMTAYTAIPEATRENIIPRLQHPIIVYSAITQLLVRRYKDQHSTAETKALLTNSCIPWNTTSKYPVRKWNLAYAHVNSDSIQWPQHSFNYIITTREQPQVTARTTAEKPFLMEYNTKATNHFSFKFGTTPAFKIPMGIELELENLTTKAQPILTQFLGQHAIFKRDGSVSRGVEICTAPATLDIHKEVFKTFFENKESGLEVKENCGLHVHVERKTIKQTQLAKIMLFMNNQKNNKFIEDIAGRQANTYCKREDTSWAQMISKTSGDKYTRVNLVNSETIEFRLFASTLDYSQFSRCLEFVQAIVDYTKSGEHNCSIKEMTEKEPFMAYIKKNRQYYPELVKFVHPELVKARPAAIQQGAN